MLGGVIFVCNRCWMESFLRVIDAGWSHFLRAIDTELFQRAIGAGWSHFGG